MQKGAKLVLKTVLAIKSGDFIEMPQPKVGKLKPAPKIFKETCQINWNDNAHNIRNFVRGLNPMPGAWCPIKGKVFKIFAVSASTNNPGESNVGAIATDNKTYLCIKALDGWVSIDQLQPEGKRSMTTEEFFRGNKIE